MTTILNDEERTLLKQILEDKYALGPFAGMVFNALVSTENATGKSPEGTDELDRLVQNALRVRLRLQHLAK